MYIDTSYAHVIYDFFYSYPPKVFAFVHVLTDVETLSHDIMLQIQKDRHTDRQRCQKRTFARQSLEHDTITKWSS